MHLIPAAWRAASRPTPDPRPRTRWWIATGVALFAAACGDSSYGSGPDGGLPAVTGPQVLAAPTNIFSPNVLTISAGDSVAFIFGSVQHNVAFAALADAPADIGGFNANTVVRRTFAKAGAYAYHCTIHPTMTGTVNVVPVANVVFLLHRAAGQFLPAIVDRRASDSSEILVHAIADTVTLRPDGTYQQSANFVVTLGGSLVGPYRWLDRGRYRWIGESIRAESERHEFVAFTATRDANGVLRIEQDLVGSGEPVFYELHEAEPFAVRAVKSPSR
jgi:plastocyanin